MLKNVSDVMAALSSGKLKEHLHSNLELKEDWQQQHGEKISALANKLNNLVSFLVVGVSDKGVLAGRNETWAKKTEEAISQHINQNLDPVQSCAEIACHISGSSWLIIIIIKSVGEVVYWGKNAYVASGTTIKVMDAEEIIQLRMQLPGLVDYTNQTYRSFYDPKLVVSFANAVKEAGHLLEIEWRGSREYSVLDYLRLNERQAARILFGKCPFRFVEYDQHGDIVRNETKQGLYQLLTDPWLRDLSQCNRCTYSPKALKEALANAVAHSAYFERDGDIIIEKYYDRITISNICLNESVYFANRWFSRSHKTINGLLMEALRVARAVDELGRGKSIIFSESIKLGTRPPEVVIESAGKYKRWKLTVHGGNHDEKLLRLLLRCRELYEDERKALIAQALVLWRDKPVKEIRGFVDDEFARMFAEVLGSFEGPILYEPQSDRILLRRWATVLLGEGKDSKALSPAEDRGLYTALRDYCLKYEEGYVTPKHVRKWAAMANTRSEQVLSSAILSEWQRKGRVVKAGHGRFRFNPMVERPESELLDLIGLFSDTSRAEHSTLLALDPTEDDAPAVQSSDVTS